MLEPAQRPAGNGHPLEIHTFRAVTNKGFQNEETSNPKHPVVIFHPKTQWEAQGRLETANGQPVMALGTAHKGAGYN